MRFSPLDRSIADRIAHWFDDPETIRYLGGRDWLYREIELVASMPGTEFRGRKVLSRYAWVGQDLYSEPCCLVVIEPYDDGTAGMAIVVAPAVRNKGVGRYALLAMEKLPELGVVDTMIGAVEPENLAAQRSYRAAGYVVADQVDDEGMLEIRKSIRTK